MIVSLSQFTRLATDENGNVLPLGRGRTACEVRTSAGAFAALGAGTKFIRIATDTAIYIDIAGGSTSSADEYFPAGTVEYLAVYGGETMTIAAA